MPQTPEERLLENISAALNIAIREGIPLNQSLLVLISSIVSSIINSSDSEKELESSFAFVKACLTLAEENSELFKQVYTDVMKGKH